MNLKSNTSIFWWCRLTAATAVKQVRFYSSQGHTKKVLQVNTGDNKRIWPQKAYIKDRRMSFLSKTLGVALCVI